MKYTFLLILVLATKILPFTNHAFEFIFPKNGHWNVILTKLNFFFFENEYIYNCVHYWRNFMNKFSIFSFGQIINKIWIIKFEVLCNV
jgi:hypothetical protein